MLVVMVQRRKWRKLQIQLQLSISLQYIYNHFENAYFFNSGGCALLIIADGMNN